MTRPDRSSPLFVLVLAAAFGVGCASASDPDDGGDGGGGGGGGTTAANVAGTWDWGVLNTTSTCGPEADGTWTVSINQTGTSITATSQWGSDVGGPYTFSGTVTGNSVAITNVTYPEEMGDLFARHDVTLQSDGSLVGTETWTWTGPGGPCENGTSDIVATRQ